MDPLANITVKRASYSQKGRAAQGRSMICDCGRPAIKIKNNAPICERCNNCEERGCVGGPLNIRVGVKPVPTTIGGQGRKARAKE